MTTDIEAAIRIIKEDYKYCGDSDYDVWMEKRHAYKTALESLEKQISKRPVIKPWNPALCPSCGMELSENSKICECGQKILREVEKNV